MEEEGPMAYVFAYGMIQSMLDLVPSPPETWFWGVCLWGNLPGECLGVGLDSSSPSNI